MTASDIRLIRAAVLEIAGNGLLAEKVFEIKVDDAVVSSIRTLNYEGRALTLICATVDVKQPADLEKETIEIPDVERRAAEAGIELVARLLALDERTSYSISSPVPYLGFLTDDSAVLDQLEGKKVDVPFSRGAPAAGAGSAGLLRPEIVGALTDRQEGVGLLAEALNSKTALGRYHELIRVFERAFALPAEKTADLLVTFLTDPGCAHHYTQAEIRHWVNYDVRGGATHADHRDYVLLDEDMRPWIPRMEEAAYEVLLNKKAWRSPSAERRDLWHAQSGSADGEAGVFMTEPGAAAVIQLRIVDGFEAYPILLAGDFLTMLPKGVWLQGEAHGGALVRNRG